MNIYGIFEMGYHYDYDCFKAASVYTTYDLAEKAIIDLYNKLREINPCIEFIKEPWETDPTVMTYKATAYESCYFDFAIFNIPVDKPL